MSHSQVSRGTYRYRGTPEEGVQGRNSGHQWTWLGEESGNRRNFTSNNDDWDQGDGTIQVCVPRQVKSASLHDIQAAFDNDRVDSGDHRAHDAKGHPNNRYLGPIQKDADKKTHGDQ